MESALYDPADGFFGTGGGAGRGGADFITSPEVGSLFGALVARALDGWWAELGEPDPFVVVEAGAGRGRLASDVLRAHPTCAPALRYVLVERSEELRVGQAELLALEPPGDVLGSMLPGEDEDEMPVPVPGLGPIVTSLSELPAVGVTGVVIVNELLDNLPVALVERRDTGWSEVRVGLDGGDFVEVLVPAPGSFTYVVDTITTGLDIPAGVRIPVPVGAADWVRAAARTLRSGWVVAIDYAVSMAQIASGEHRDWLRTYRNHERGNDPLRAPGTQDITCDVLVEYLAHSTGGLGFEALRLVRQRDWLRQLGLDDLVAEAHETWSESRGSGTLESLAARSRVHEADALTDPHGLGAHTVFMMRQ